MREDILKVLKMVEEGKVKSEEALKLIEAMGVEEEMEPRERKPSILRVKVEDEDGTKVNVNVPLKLAKIALKLIPKGILGKLKIGDLELQPELERIDPDELISALSEVPEGKIVEVKEPGGTLVEIMVE